jgi:hypothetical protein
MYLNDMDIGLLRLKFPQVRDLVFQFCASRLHSYVHRDADLREEMEHIVRYYVQEPLFR